MTARLPLLAALLVAGVSCSKTVDPCAGVPGTCLSVQIEGAGLDQIDNARFTVSFAATSVTMSTTTPNNHAATLPVAVAVDLRNLPPGTTQTVTVEVTGLTGTIPVGRGSQMVQVTDGAHVPVTVVIRPGDPLPNCADYCDKITAHCQDVNKQYDSNADCLAHCVNAEWPPGTAGDMSGNTLFCRTYHSEVAAGNPTFHCQHAGISGGNLCGNWCENYCRLARNNCVGSNQLFPDDATCMTACAAYPSNASTNATSGNSVQCRINFLGLAGVDPAQAASHCPQGAPDGGVSCK